MNKQGAITCSTNSKATEERLREQMIFWEAMAQIDREAKEKKGQRTAKPSTPKVPVKVRGGSGVRGGMGSFGSGSGLRGSVNK